MKLARMFVGPAAAALASVAQAGVTFTTFISGGSLVSATGGTSPIGFAYAGDRFVGSANYPGGNQLYQSDLTGLNVTPFGAPLAGFSGEIFVASSFSSGAYGSNTLFAGAESSGSVVKLAHDGSSQSVFTSGLIGGVRSIAFDPYGLYGGQMIVATNAGRIYKVSSTGVATLFSLTGEDTEGITFANQNFGAFPLGTLFVASEGSGSIRAIDPSGVVTTAFTVSGAETVSFVPLNIGLSGDPVEGFYGVNFPNDIQKSPASDFVPYAGHAIVTDEFGHGIYDVAPTGGSFTITNIGIFPAQPEDSIFVTADAVRQHSVPDAAGTALLLGCGIASLALLRRRFATVSV